jgi:CelD/BcsL family acetyltransferase involved in cellulose biosynthesis
MLPGPGGWEQFYATKISGSSRQTDRRKFKNLAKQGTIEFVEPHETADLHRTVDAMIAQKRVSYQRMAVADVFANTGYPEFFHSIATDSRFRDMVHVTRIDVGGVMAATGLAAVFNGCYYLLFSSYDEVYARNSPGRKHMHELLRYAINRNLRIFDFTIGDEPYKLDWSDIHVRMLTYVHGYTLRGLLAVSMKTMRYHVDVWYNRPGKLLRTKRFVKTGKRLLRRTGH